MSFTTLDDDRVRALLREELDKREREKQLCCLHMRSGTLVASKTVRCDECGILLEWGEHGGIEVPAPTTNEESE